MVGEQCEVGHHVLVSAALGNFPPSCPSTSETNSLLCSLEVESPWVAAAPGAWLS